jgi:hypothetical protein
MKLKLKLNIENFQNIEITTNEYKNLYRCYAEIGDFLEDWIDITGHAQKLYEHIEVVLSQLSNAGRVNEDPQDEVEKSGEVLRQHPAVPGRTAGSGSTPQSDSKALPVTKK